MIEKLFNLQETYYEEFGQAIKLNKNLKELLLNYNEKYRIINKKAHRLQEKSETIEIKNNLSKFLNREANKRVKDTLLNNKNNEMKIIKDIFKLPITNKDYKLYVDEKNLLSGILNLF